MSHRCTECRAVAVESAGTVCLACWYWIAAGANRIAVVLPTPEPMPAPPVTHCEGLVGPEGWPGLPRGRITFDRGDFFTSRKEERVPRDFPFDKEEGR